MAILFEFDLAGEMYRLAIADRHFYVLDDGSVLPIRTWPAWCERCQKFTAAEQIFAIAEEARQLNEVEYFATHPGFIPTDRHVPISQLPDLRMRNSWREKRVSPAKCLTCGSTRITSIWPGPEVEIPDRGMCLMRIVGRGDIVGPANEYYGPEGDRLTL